MLSFAKSLVGGAVAATALWAVVGAHAQTAAPAAPSATPPAAAASAENTPHGKGQRHPHGFKLLDTNKDGQISREEAKAHPRLSQNFDAIDTDKNSQLSKGELKAAKAARRGNRPAAN